MHKVHERAHASEIEDCLTHVSFHMYVVCTSADKYVTQFLSCVQMEHITFKSCVMHVCAFWENSDLKQQQQCCFRSNSIVRRDIPTVSTYVRTYVQRKPSSYFLPCINCYCSRLCYTKGNYVYIHSIRTTGQL